MRNVAVLISGERGHDEWPTPSGVFEALDKEFHFTLDVAATEENAKCPQFYTRRVDGLLRPWEGVVWCNPPYSGDNIRKWVRKAAQEAERGITSVLLLPARTGNAWFHDYCLAATEIRFLRGRLTFGQGPHPAPFDSMVVIFRGDPLR